MSSSEGHSQLTLTSVPERIRNPAWWKRRTKLERKLCISTITTLVMLSLLTVALAILGYLYQKDSDSRHAVFYSLNSDPSSSRICLTPGCVKAASNVLSFIDESVEPCNDFYRFACGGWLKQHTVIPEDKSSVSIFSEVADDLEQKLKELLEKKIGESEPSFIKMAKDMYDTCMDLKKIEKAGSEPVKKVLKTFGGWPVVEGSKWREFNFDWIESLISFRKLGFSHRILMNMYVYTDSRNNTANTIKLDQTIFGMPDRAYLMKGLNDSATVAYYELMVKSAKLLGADEETAEKEMLKALNFEIALANISLPREERRNVSKLYNKFTVKQLQERVPLIPWLKYFNGLLEDEIHENETLIVAVPEFVKKFSQLITKTEKRVVANYMLWRVVGQSMSHLSKDWRELLHEYYAVISGTTREAPQWKQCLSHVRGALGIAISSYYVRNYFDEDSKDVALELVRYVRKEFLHILENIDWMDKETKRHAKDKANAMMTFIGYPEELLNNTALQELYEGLTLTTESHFNNIRKIYKWSTDSYFSELRKPKIKGDWRHHAHVAQVNAYYFSMDNAMDFPAGILQMFYFDKDRPHYMNFGSIGFVIGHEITHGFDDQGRQFDKRGNNVNWWGKATDEHFREKAQCIIDQYSNYTAENGMNLNGINNQGENIADNGGIKEAYWAYKSWVKDNGPEPLLPGVKYTQNQLFWMSAASVWCERRRHESLKLSIMAGAHSPGEFRITGPMSNIQEFSNEFNCPPGSPMNKKKKCQVW